MNEPVRHGVTRLDALAAQPLRWLLARYAIDLVELGAAVQIPGSFWGAPEAGLAGSAVFARGDTPVHSVLHEAAHYVCMPSRRRLWLYRDAGGDPDEECAVCYLQVVWADYVTGYSQRALFDDMDTWGYSFREGGVRDWIAGDARHAREWLQVRELLDNRALPTWRLRMLP
jgi:hypothetical protein